jgi:hypothetical protein
MSSQSSMEQFNRMKEHFYKEGELPLLVALHAFSELSNQNIITAWDTWARERQHFYTHYHGISIPLQSCPPPPPEGTEYALCREMWVHTLRKFVEENKEHFQTEGIKQTVDKIVASDAWKSHPANCPCKVPNNPFTCWEVLEVIDALGVTHNPYCHCNPPSGCKKQAKVKAMVGSGATGIATSTYKHNVDNCACGTCHKARVDSGKEDAYYERCLNASRAILKTLAAQEKAHNPKTCACGTCHTARVASGTQGEYDEWNRKAVQAALGKFVADSGYSATMRRVYCPSHPANQHPANSLMQIHSEQEAKLFQEGNCLLHKLTKIIGPDKFQERLTLIREFVPKLEAFLEPGTGGLLDSTLRKAMECDDHISTREALAASWGHMQGLLADVFSKLPPGITPLV